MRKEKIWINVRDSFWFLPAIYGVMSIVLVFVVNSADSWIMSHLKEQLPNIALTSSDVAKELYASLVTAILTMTTISFSVIMVVLTTYTTQFSPRTLQDFMRSSTTQHVLGMYCFGFVFALLHLLLVGKGSIVIGPILMGIIAIMVLGFFVYFIHHSARWIQVNNLISKIRIDGSNVIKHAYQQQDYLEYEEWNEGEVRYLQTQTKRHVCASKSGYVQEIDWKGLVNWAKHENCIVHLHVQIGDFVLMDSPVISGINLDQWKKLDDIQRYLIICNERTDLQDVEFSLQKLVEIALRAISPAINDPHTAINCINRIGALLSEVSTNYKEIYYLADKAGNLRVINEPKKYEDYLYKSFYQIRHYGKDDVSVLYGLIEVLYKIAFVSNKKIKQKIWRFHYYIVDVIEWDTLSELDRQHLQSIYRKFRSCYGE
ncbi:DUF2254 domain-containing protein [Virgibacillus dakarensis]|uniref:DUF2254 domain-containing protein n=1 Tax=Virgibacillus dakarensis TaxID=1917889 RepID=UPI000B44286D|nr:DUF2254 domain-containing protein [Virgibacillus dakarensis]